MDAILIIIAAVIALVAGFAAGSFRRVQDMELRKKEAEEQSNKILENARLQSENLLKKAELDAKEISLKEHEQFENISKQERLLLQERERILRIKEENIEKRIDSIDRKEDDIERRESAMLSKEFHVQEQLKKVEHFQNTIDTKLIEISSLSREEAKKQLLESVENDVRIEMAKKIKQIEDETREAGERKAKRIIAIAIQRYAGEYVSERTISVVNLPNDEMKGRIIGREGRNIRALEAATGVDLIIDDTPEAVIVSGFNPLRREVARVSLERLIADGRIHPSRIEEVVKKVEEEIETSIREAGEQATFELGLNGVHTELIRLIGLLKYRTSYGQNQLSHSIEVGHLAGLMATELGLNVKYAKRGGVLHDIGKVIDQSVEGSHAVIGAEFARRYGEHPLVVNAIAAHHEEVPMESIYAVLVQAADALSGARPGARREVLESYIKRLEDLERIAKSYPGVEKSYAVQAGRELRIIVSNNEVSDAEAVLLSRNISRQIESELTYPGQIKVSVVRETRAVDYAR